MSKISDLFKTKSSGIHFDPGGGWGTDDHDASIIKALAEFVKTIGDLLKGGKK